MPTYEYDCKDCGDRVEFFQSMSEGPKRKCPSCGAPRGLKRRIGTGAGIIFRGSGFYITDYRSDSYKKQAKKEMESSGASGSSGKNGGSKGSSKKEKPASGTTKSANTKSSDSSVKAAGS